MAMTRFICLAIFACGASRLHGQQLLSSPDLPDAPSTTALAPTPAPSSAFIFKPLQKGPTKPTAALFTPLPESPTLAEKGSDWHGWSYEHSRGHKGKLVYRPRPNKPKTIKKRFSH